MKEIIVMLSPARIQQGKMSCVFYENKFVLTFKREALIDFSAGKSYEIPLNEINKICDIGVLGKGIEISLKNKNIDFPRGASASFVGGLVGAIIASKNINRFILYFNYKEDKIAFLANCKLSQNSIVYNGNVTNQDLENYIQKTHKVSNNINQTKYVKQNEKNGGTKVPIIILISSLIILSLLIILGITRTLT